MSESPSISNTLIDNLIGRKEMREGMIRRARARDRIEFTDHRRNFWNTLGEANGHSPLSKFLIKQKLDETDYPTHLALIPDGNRTWARNRGLRVELGYAKGAKTMEDLRELALVSNRIKTLSIFLLSTENIERRPEDELDQLYNVFVEFFNRVAEDEFVQEHEIKHEVRGNKDDFSKLPQRVLDAINRMEEATSNFNNRKVVFLMPYGGRDEIVKAASEANFGSGRMSRGSIGESGEDEESFRDNLVLGDLPDVDLMIRTSQKRISNFMLYHNAYAEFVFHQKNWPSFTESDFYESIYKYSNRDRRFGV